MTARFRPPFRQINLTAFLLCVNHVSIIFVYLGKVTVINKRRGRTGRPPYHKERHSTTAGIADGVFIDLVTRRGKSSFVYTRPNNDYFS